MNARMMDAVAKRVEEIFYDALEVKAPDKRKAFLDHACAGDSKLRSAVEEMLSMQTDVERFFRDGRPVQAQAREISQAMADAPGLRESVGAVLSTEEEIGKRIGPYKLLQKIGEGGCGSVYMAEQEVPVRRRVALKVIKLGMDTKNVIARFEAERQALAMMDHPNIARVLDASATEAGRPYFVMELVRGVKITAYCDENCLDARRRLDLFIQVCHAIQHAHQKGIIHRDIKPSNILITMHDGVPVPKVIDFGIAKATNGQLLTNKTLFTAYEQFVGTPAYMSPEQAELSALDVDTRSDIYSMGVLLYELLTGKTPFDQQELLQSGIDEMRRTLREKEPQRPSTRLTTLRGTELEATAEHRHTEPPRLISLLKGDLDWIVMKALEKDRARRYETANGLAMDVQRYLDNEPVDARPPSRFYHFQKLVRRNKATVAAVLAVIMALVIGIGLSTWLLLKERVARQRAVAAEQQANRLRQQAEDRQKLTQATVLLSRDKIEEADRLVAGIPVPEPNLECAELFRALGDWNAYNAHWKQAADRFAVLLRVNRPDDWDNTTLDYLRYGPLPLESGNSSEYQQFRELAVAHYAKTTNPVAAERVIKISLLAPAGADLLAALQPLSAIAAKPPFEGQPGAWRAFSLALMEYRLGNDAGAESWCGKSVVCHNKNPSLTANLQVLLAMIHRHQGKTDLARSELAQTREEIENYFNHGPAIGSASEGYWFDWVFARILCREAETLIGEPQLWNAPEQADSHQ
jgi:eukaryotic-like serine/threonine-protein kinase